MCLNKSAVNSRICTFLNRLRRWKACRHGATAIEYALIAGTVSLGIALVVFGLGDNVLGLYDEVFAALQKP